MAEDQKVTPIRRKLHPTRIKEASQARNEWVVTPEEGTPFDALVDADGMFFAHVATKFSGRPGDILHIYPEDNSYYARLYVRAAGREFAKVAVLEYVPFDVKEEMSGAVAPGYEVQWAGNYHKFRILRTADKAVMKTGFAKREDAVEWLVANSKSLAA